MKKLSVFIGIIIANVSIIQAYAASLPVRPEDTSYPDSSGCASEFEFSSCTSSHPDMPISSYCRQLCNDLTSQSVTTKTVTRGNIKATFPWPQIYVKQNCTSAGVLDCEVATDDQAAIGGYESEKGTITCVAGYYGNPRSLDDQSACALCTKGYYCDGTNGRVQCPYDTVTKTYGTTSGAGAKSASECYIPSGTDFSDTKGDGHYSSDCKY